MAAPVKQGDILSGKYQVERVLGEGAMGVVVAATHLQLRERVALKFLLLEVSQGSEPAARFLREARAAVKIKSEHVARVTDVGTLESGAPYMVMEYLEGRDLAAHLEEKLRLPLSEAVEYVLQACEAVAEAHLAGIIHRDLKPANLFLTKKSNGDPCVKVLDFGISKMIGDTSADKAQVTRTSAVMGSPAYMSPEQLRASKNVDMRSDIWALGAILYELVTGEIPFPANTMPELCAEILTAPAPDVRKLRPDLPEEIGAVITKCLRKDPNDRYLSVSQLMAALEPFAPLRTRAGDRYTGATASAGTPAELASVLAAPPAARASNAAAGTNAFNETIDAPTRINTSEPRREPVAKDLPAAEVDTIPINRSSTAFWGLAGAFLVSAIGFAAWQLGGLSQRGAASAAAPLAAQTSVAPAISAPAESPATAVVASGTASATATPREEPVALAAEASATATAAAKARPAQPAAKPSAAPPSVPQPTETPAPPPTAPDFGGRK